MHSYQRCGRHHFPLSALDVEVIPHQQSLGASDIVDLKTNMVTQTVREESGDGSRLLDLIKVTAQKTQLAQPLESHVAGVKLKLVVNGTGSDSCYTFFLHAL